MGSRWRTGAIALALAAGVVVASCSAQRAAPSMAPPTPPTATSTTVAPTATTAVATAASSTTTTSRPTTTTIAPAIPVRAWAEFDRRLKSQLLGAGDFAASVAVAVDGRVVHAAAWGDRNPRIPRPAPDTTVRSTSTTVPTTRPEPRDPVQPSDRFRIASISKILGATVVLRLVEDGDLALDDAVGARLARLVGARGGDPAIAKITVRQLLSHTSGLPQYEQTFFGGGVASCREAATRGLSGGLVAPPGTVYNYSNLNFCVLTQLVEDVTGDDYEAVVRARLLRPLGIDGMRIAGTFDPRPGEVQHPSIPSRNYMETLGGAGAWVASPSDLVRIVASLDLRTPGWHPLGARSLALMRRPAPPPVAYSRPDDHWYGLGLIVYADGSFGHTGTIENTHAMVLHRADGITWSVLVSGEYPSETDRLASFVDEAFAASGIVATP